MNEWCVEQHGKSGAEAEVLRDQCASLLICVTGACDSRLSDGFHPSGLTQRVRESKLSMKEAEDQVSTSYSPPAALPSS